jgi:hypothetical protein
MKKEMKENKSQGRVINARKKNVFYVRSGLAFSSIAFVVFILKKRV